MHCCGLSTYAVDIPEYLKSTNAYCLLTQKIHNTKLLEYMRKRLNIKSGDSVLLIPCRLRKRKGLSFVAEALSKLSVPEHKIKVIITGIPESQEEILIYQDFKNRIGDVEVINHDRFSDEDMPILYNIADITVLCSEAEGYGTIFLEAMACECPVIGSDVIGVNESVTNGYNGILCKFGDYNSLDNAISKILTDTKARKKFVKNSLLILKSKYNLRKQAKNHLKLFKTYCNHDQETACVLYRYAERQEEVCILKNNNSRCYKLPRISKKINESWLQAAIKKARMVSGYKVIIPNHLILDNVDKNKVSYSFQIKSDTLYVGSRTSKFNSGIWLNLDKAILMVSNKNDKKVLQELKTKLRDDNHVKPTT